MSNNIDNKINMGRKETIGGRIFFRLVINNIVMIFIVVIVFISFIM